jgi:hypothetical protein
MFHSSSKKIAYDQKSHDFFFQIILIGDHKHVDIIRDFTLLKFAQLCNSC